MASGAVIGIDIGGSRTRAVRCLDGTVTGEAATSSANIAAVGPVVAAQRLAEVLAAVGTDGVAAVCAGAAGADSPDTVAQVRELIAAQVPDAAVEVVHDAQLLLAAAGRDHGIALVSGTGSAAWGRAPDGAQARAGGWGHLLGDEGSGYWVTMEAVRHALREMDRGTPVDDLTAALLADCGLTRREQLIDRVHRDLDKRYWADRAGVVAELAGRSDPAAARIMAAAADALAALVTVVGERIGPCGPVVVAGGFAAHQPALVDAVRQRLPGISVEVLTTAPVHGAVRLAEAMTTAGART